MKKIIALGLATTTALVFAGCFSIPALCDNGTCDAESDGGVGEGGVGEGSVDGGVDVVVPPGCETPNEPVKNPEKCLVDSYGVYVSPSGDDGNAGTRTKPYKTVGKGLSAGRGRVVVCEGTYAESVEVKSDVEVYSGVTCDFGKAGGRAKVVGTKPEYAVKIGKVTATLAELDIEGAAGTAGSRTSVGVWAVEAVKVSLRKVGVEAKGGFAGEAGAGGTTGTYATGNGNGNPASASAGGAAKPCTCSSGGVTAGGRGGAPLDTAGSGARGARRGGAERRSGGGTGGDA